MADVQTQNALIEAHAVARHVRMSPQKARLVMDLIRGQKAQDALHTLKYTPKRAAKHIEKVLRSAIANAERKAEDSGAPLDVDMLFVAQCFVNEGPRWKRLRPAPMGRAFRYQKRTAHLWVGVAEHHVAADRKSTRLNSSHDQISYAVFCLKKKKKEKYKFTHQYQNELHQNKIIKYQDLRMRRRKRLPPDSTRNHM